MTLAVAAGTLLVFAGILFISWRADEGVQDFRRWYVVAPLLAAILGGVIYPLRRYALRFSDEPVYFGAIVGIVGLICTAIFIALPTTKDRLVWHRQSIGYFIGGGALNPWASCSCSMRLAMVRWSWLRRLLPPCLSGS